MTCKKRLKFSNLSKYNFSWSNVSLESFRHFGKGISFHKHVFKHVRETFTRTFKALFQVSVAAARHGKTGN